MKDCDKWFRLKILLVRLSPILIIYWNLFSQMKFVFLVFFTTVSLTFSYSQNPAFPFGQVTTFDLEKKTYPIDTTASAVVLDEFGEAYIQDGNDYNLIFEYHVKIKILKREGLENAEIKILLYGADGQREQVSEVQASAFNLENGRIKETKLETKNIFKEDLNKFWSAQKFAIPNAQVGSVIEFQYKIESPYIFKFRGWKFQDDLPKLRSEYWATIPAIYTYNITLRGFLKLKAHDRKIIKECAFQGRADCTLNKFIMENIPAFVEEDFMTAASNFKSSINFELSEIHHLDGRVTGYTEEWRDVEIKLRSHDKFGIQLRKGKDIVDEHVELTLFGEQDSLVKAKKIYDFVKNWYRWDGTNGIFSEFGIKKAFQNKVGNIGDINLTLIAALRQAGLSVDPVILSTRDNGIPIDLHPVVSDFNFVIAKLNVNGRSFLLDATDDFLPFGVIPFQCFNGKARVLTEKSSYWLTLTPTEKAKKTSTFNLKLEKDGYLRGTITHAYYGYDAISKRKEIASFDKEENYLQDLKNNRHNIQFLKSEIMNVEDLSKPVVEKFEVEIKMFDDMNADHYVFNPFFENRISANPFKSSERLYPVDYGIPKDESLTLSLEFPEHFEITELPPKAGLSLPNAGGRYLFSVQTFGNKIVMNNILNISRTIYTTDEYQYLKELYNRIIQIQNADLVFQRKQ
jgi:hypothetical protein